MLLCRGTEYNEEERRALGSAHGPAAHRVVEETDNGTYPVMRKEHPGVSSTSPLPMI
jgi:hypothetical protein